MMMISLHNLSKEYGTLPGETLSRASTFDLQVLNIATRWENKKYEDQQVEAGLANKKPKALSKKDLDAMWKQKQERKAKAKK